MILIDLFLEQLDETLKKYFIIEDTIKDEIEDVFKYIFEDTIEDTIEDTLDLYCYEILEKDDTKNLKEK